MNFFDGGLNALGVPTVYEPNDGLHAGATYLPLDISPTNQSRADARRSYYDPYSGRPNFSVSTNRYVTQLIYQGDGCANNHTDPIPGDDSTGTGSASGDGSEDGGGLNGGGSPPLKRKRQTTTQRVIGVEVNLTLPFVFVLDTTMLIPTAACY